MNLGELESELALYVQDDSLVVHFKGWINNAINEIAGDFALPALKLKDPVPLTITESGWLYDMPSSYMKKLYKCYDSNWDKVTISHALGDIDELDIDHDDTGDHVTHVAVRDSQIGVYPMAAEDIKLWFYELPTDLVESSDVPTCIPNQYHDRVIIPKVLVKSYHMLIDMAVKPPHQTLAWWMGKYRAGLYGEPGSDVGMINCLSRDKGVVRTGGRDPLP
jgi:hypothetical protein